jgi:hypothetical protein
VRAREPRCDRSGSPKRPPALEPARRGRRRSVARGSFLFAEADPLGLQSMPPLSPFANLAFGGNSPPWMGIKAAANTRLIRLNIAGSNADSLGYGTGWSGVVTATRIFEVGRPPSAPDHPDQPAAPLCEAVLYPPRGFHNLPMRLTDATSP